MKNDEMLEQLKKISASIRSKEYLPFYYIYGNEDYRQSASGRASA